MEKDKFSELLGDKLKDFEVPYNEAHWSEMSNKLDGIPTTGNPSIFSSTTFWAVASTVVVAGAIYLWSNSDTTVSEPQEIVQNEAQNSSIVENEDIAAQTEYNSEPSTSNNSETQVLTKDSEQSEAEEDAVDDKMEHYADMTEDQVKEESKSVVDKMVKDQEDSFKNTPNIDNSALKSNVLVESQILCDDMPISFKVDREISGAKYYWNFGDNGLTSRKMNPKHTFKKPGNYTVTLLISKGEKNDYMAEKEVIIGGSPKVEIEWDNKEITLNDPYMPFEASGCDQCTYEWTFNDEIKSTGKRAEFVVKKKGFHSVVLTAKSKNGCLVENTESVHTPKGITMDVESAFSPNGDGNNDQFMPKELEISDVQFTLIVKDMTGQQVFESHDKYKAWNGKMENSGVDMPEGQYAWFVTFTDDRGKVHEQKGRISILR